MEKDQLRVWGFWEGRRCQELGKGWEETGIIPKSQNRIPKSQMIPPGDPAAGTAGNAPLQSHFHANVTSMKNWEVQLRLWAGIAVNMFGLGINPVFFPHSFGLPVLQLLLESPPELAAPISSKSMSGGAPAHPAVGIPSPHPSFCPLSQECHPWSIPVALIPRTGRSHKDAAASR